MSSFNLYRDYFATVKECKPDRDIVRKCVFRVLDEFVADPTPHNNAILYLGAVEREAMRPYIGRLNIVTFDPSNPTRPYTVEAGPDDIVCGYETVRIFYENERTKLELTTLSHV